MDSLYFPNFLRMRYKLVSHKDVPTNMPIENMLGGYYPQVLYCHVISTLDYVAEDAAYLVCKNVEIQKLAKWVCDNLINTIVTDTRKTFLVKLRIAIGMLNKLEEKGIIDKTISLFYFDNIITNCNDLWFDYAFDSNCNELPF